ncbi:hypothetical protein NP493_55g03000 [Ridgeia piscesae]|uniref:Uncharacterized protein n=1 Tax=Ridgeia piscesae TaxID=27915 RepID=A0AAD9PAT0_RIDPI|nr:hypothetical protein NP493_55g03000 [Ridgeia piscesae]
MKIVVLVALLCIFALAVDQVHSLADCSITCTGYGKCRKICMHCAMCFCMTGYKKVCQCCD